MTMKSKTLQIVLTVLKWLVAIVGTYVAGENDLINCLISNI